MPYERDIVEVLREGARAYKNDDGPAHAWRYERAADEIEKLREALMQANYTLCVHGHIDGGTPLHEKIHAALKPSE